MSRTDSSTVEACKAWISGIKENVSPKTSFTLLNQTFTPAQLCALIQDRVDKNAATIAAKAQYRAAVKDERDAEEAVRPLRLAFKAHISGQVGPGSLELEKYGFKPRNPKAPTPAAKAQAAAQAVATRKARNPLTKDEKKKIKGVVASPASPAAPASPAPANPTASPQPAAAQNGAPSTGGH